MLDDQSILALERLRDDLLAFRGELRKRYRTANRPVAVELLKANAAKLAEIWLVEFARRPELAETVSSELLGETSVHFQRILTYSERNTQRGKYDREITQITKGFTNAIIIPLKQSAQRITTRPAPRVFATRAANPTAFSPTAFVAHSFADSDKDVVTLVIDVLAALGIRTSTGQKPQANKISDKVKALIDEQHFFVAVFTRRDRLAKRQAWTTSMWLIDEKVYAMTQGKRLILLKEEGVDSIGGLQGDYEYVEFSRDRLHEVALSLMRYFDVAVRGLN